jgi:predicted ribosome quality control (RQC) complex YloA/Tae2 family protein
MVSKNARWDFQGYRKNDSLMILVGRNPIQNQIFFSCSE